MRSLGSAKWWCLAATLCALQSAPARAGLFGGHREEGLGKMRQQAADELTLERTIEREAARDSIEPEDPGDIPSRAVRDADPRLRDAGSAPRAAERDLREEPSSRRSWRSRDAGDRGLRARNSRDDAADQDAAGAGAARDAAPRSGAARAKPRTEEERDADARDGSVRSRAPRADDPRFDPGDADRAGTRSRASQDDERSDADARGGSGRGGSRDGDLRDADARGGSGRGGSRDGDLRDADARGGSGRGRGSRDGDLRDAEGDEPGWVSRDLEPHAPGRHRRTPRPAALRDLRAHDPLDGAVRVGAAQDGAREREASDRDARDPRPAERGDQRGGRYRAGDDEPAARERSSPGVRVREVPVRARRAAPAASDAARPPEESPGA